jgi:NADH-quinone oxidoreductase subunit I
MARKNAWRVIYARRLARPNAFISKPNEERIGRDERYAKVYNIDYTRCIFCGFCVEACPKDAITHGYNFELSVYNRADLLKTKDDLLITKQKQSKNYRIALSGEDVDSEYKEV